jgi:L-seryl-tRNA(Ser) seleniumtransferase
MTSVLLSEIASVDEVVRSAIMQIAIARFGRPVVVAAVRNIVNANRAALRAGQPAKSAASDIAAVALTQIEANAQPNARPVFNLTGTILHTNLGRAALAEEAIDAAIAAMRQPIALEFDLTSGRRGDRDDLVRDILCELTGAEDATIVNNNAAAILLVLNTLGKGRDSIVSRGELIEIGGAFRLPDIMARAGTKLIEVGTTNRTHPGDYEAAIGPRTGLLLKVHTSNYRIEGFTKEVSPRALAVIARARDLPLVHDLGSGTLIDLSRYGLSPEPTVAESILAGADLVTFSGDKLLGGPQAGFIIGRAKLIKRINQNPLKRALRIDKMRLAAVEATLRLYRDPDRLTERLPVLRHITRTESDIAALVSRVMPSIAAMLCDRFTLEAISCASQIGSGALPQQTLPSVGIGIRPNTARGAGRLLTALAKTFRDLPRPVIGRITEQTLILDLRCLDDEAEFLRNLGMRKAIAVRDT